MDGIKRDDYNFCEREAVDLNQILNYFIIAHVVGFIVTFNREIYDSNIQFIGQIMKFTELIGGLGYYSILVISISEIFFWDNKATYANVVEHLEDNLSLYQKQIMKQALPICYENKSLTSQWCGCVLQWFLIEQIVFFSYAITMVILMIKARIFLSVSLENAFQFEPKQMLALAERIINSIDFDFPMKKRSKAKTRSKFIDREQAFEVEGVRLKIKLNEEDYDNLYEKVFHKQPYLTEEEVTGWV